MAATTISIKGTAEYKRRLKAVKAVFKPIARKWSEGTAPAYTAAVPVRPASMRAGDKHEPGRLKRSFSVRTRTRTRAVIDGHYTAYFINKGVQPHSMARRAKGQDRTVFAKKHPGYAARPFLKRLAWEELRKHPMSASLIDVWNEAA